MCPFAFEGSVSFRSISESINQNFNGSPYFGKLDSFPVLGEVEAFARTVGHEFRPDRQFPNFHVRRKTEITFGIVGFRKTLPRYTDFLCTGQQMSFSLFKINTKDCLLSCFRQFLHWYLICSNRYALIFFFYRGFDEVCFDCTDVNEIQI